MKMGYKVDHRTFVFETDRYFPSCHASTVCKTAEGGYLCAWFGGSGESNRDVSIWVARSDDGLTFGEPQKIRAVDEAHWNPVLDVMDGGGYALYFKVSTSPRDWATMVCYSDDGATWSKPRELVPGDFSGGRGPVKNPILHYNGMLIAPRSLESDTAWTVENDVSFDGGKTWLPTKPVDYVYDDVMAAAFRDRKQNGIIQPTLWADGEGVHMLMRSTWGAVYRSDSNDGLEWSPAYRTDLPNNNSGICAALSEGALALCYNPVGSNWGARTPLVTEFSYDGGRTFGGRITLEDGPGEFSYPTLIADGEGFAVSYTWKRKNIVFARIKAESDG